MKRYLSRTLGGLALGLAVIAVLVVFLLRTEAQQDGYEIDFGDSELYTEQEIDDAIEVAMAEFDTWEGCTMKRIAYAGDELSASDLAYCNELRPDAGYDACIVLVSDFHSPKQGGGAWNADQDYEGWSWHLARKGTGTWELLTWGFG